LPGIIGPVPPPLWIRKLVYAVFEINKKASLDKIERL